MPETVAETLRPAEFCRLLLNALDVSAARSKRRKRDQKPDEAGMAIKRDLMLRCIQEDPAADEFGPWLLDQVLAADVPGPVRSMGQDMLQDYRLAASLPSFAEWLDRGAFFTASSAHAACVLDAEGNCQAHVEPGRQVLPTLGGTAP